MTEHPSPVEPAEIFRIEFLLLHKANVNKNNILGGTSGTPLGFYFICYMI